MSSKKRSAPPAELGPSALQGMSTAQSGRDQQQAQNWKKRKQERAHTARFIETQTSKVASSASSSRNTSKSSTPVPTQLAAAAAGLPTSIELESLVSSRAFQIQSFLRSIKSAKSATTTRAWQLLPRHARRRAASHNLLRLPTRLRSKALAELRSSTTQARTRSDIRKRLPSYGVIRATLRRKKLAERASHPQRRWLETHLWHAKRFRMTTEKGKGKERDQGTEHNRWGFVLPETTMMKSHRASWRSALEFVTVHDTSYFSVFRLGVRQAQASTADGVSTALAEQLHQVLAKVGLAEAAELKPEDIAESHRVIDTVLVRPTSDSTSSTQSEKDTVAAALAPVRVVILSGTRQFERPSLDQSTTYIHSCKEALLIVHPAADINVRRALKAASVTLVDENKNALFDLELPAPDVMQAYAFQLDSTPDPWLAAGGKDSSLSKLEKKRRRRAYQTGSAKSDEVGSSSKRPHETLLLDDKAELKRKHGFNIFELVGPRAASLLRSVLKCQDGAEGNADGLRLRQMLEKHSKTSKRDSPEMVQVRVSDPRLSYPPKLKPVATTQCSAGDPAKATGDADSDRDDLFWTGAQPPTFSKGEIDSRRALNAIPGARLQPDSRDDVVPVVVMRDRLAGKVDRYMLVVPRGWGTAFFLSLVATHQSGASSGARVLGQHQLRHQKLELAAQAQAAGEHTAASMLSYPHNWLGTRAYADSEKRAEAARYEQWSRRPKGKRAEFAFASHKDWVAFQQSKTAEEIEAKLALDRTGVARPYPFGGSHHWEWIVGNSQRLFAGGKEVETVLPWLVAQPDVDLTRVAGIEARLSASSLASAMVAVKLQAVRKGTVTALSSLMLAPTFEEHLHWVHHLEPVHHPALVRNRTAAAGDKMDKQYLKALVERRCKVMQLGGGAPAQSIKFKPISGVWREYTFAAMEPEEMHGRSANWNNAVGTVLDGDYSLSNGRGFGVGALTLRAWMVLTEWQERMDKQRDGEAATTRRPRNAVETRNLLLVREPGSNVVRPVSATLVPLV
ncbi:ribonucleases P/MRP protein subunit [Moesziomyces antarcticus T-34]|uniref:Ribonucleases P/MRP protein subunit n=1 Tax=Pseudozyma antarctica (strain T-34) TaxID=1151754 RepID=M9MGE5_PSEA3|nr:ribonucleases P/MRP protein subunit [Moesziomyces antarcticus T-34]